MAQKMDRELSKLVPGLREPLADIAAAPVIDRIRLMTKVRILVSFGKLCEIPNALGFHLCSRK